jgi:hypothetical protein
VRRRHWFSGELPLKSNAGASQSRESIQ